MYPFDIIAKYSNSTVPQETPTHFMQRISSSQSNKFMAGLGVFIIGGLLWNKFFEPMVIEMFPNTRLAEHFAKKDSPEHLTKVVNRNSVQPSAVNPNRSPGWMSKNDDLRIIEGKNQT
jgi:hypothetical protein